MVAPFESSQLQFIIETSISAIDISKKKKKVTDYHNNKTTTVRNLTRRAQVFCDSPDSVTDEIKYSEMAL